MISKHSAHSTSLPVGFRTWLWRYICLLLLISMLWHRQAIFESKGDKMSSSAECRIRTWKSQDTYSPADWMSTHKPTELSRIKPHTNTHTHLRRPKFQPRRRRKPFSTRLIAHLKTTELSRIGWKTELHSPPVSLQWRHNDNDDVSNYQPHGCLLNRLFRGRSK